MQFIIDNRKTLEIVERDDWAGFADRYLKKNPHARVYRKDYADDLYVSYRLDKAKRHPRQVRRDYIFPHETPANIRALMLITNQ